MRQLTSAMWMTLDGIVQGAGRADEDDRDGFIHGGWATAAMDETVLAETGPSSGEGGEIELVLGHRTYDDFHAFWPAQGDDNPFNAVLERTVKHVATRNPAADLGWANSRRLDGEAGEALTALKATPGPDLMVQGSAELVRSLQGRGLIDRYKLIIAPVVLGEGRRLFEAGPRVDLRLERSVSSPNGVTINTYRSA